MPEEKLGRSPLDTTSFSAENVTYEGFFSWLLKPALYFESFSSKTLSLAPLIISYDFLLKRKPS